MNARDFLLRHSEKIAAGSFVAWLFLGAGALARPPQGLTEGAKVDEQLSRIEAHMATKVVVVPPVEDYSAELRRQLEPPKKDPGQFPAWAFHRRPNVVFSLPPKPEALVPEHLPPKDLKVEASHGKIALSWAKGESKHLNVTRYEVWRKTGEGQFEKLAEVAPDRTSYTDTNVKPRSLYVYRIQDEVALSRDDVPAEQELAKCDKPTLGSDEAQAATLRDICFKLIEATPADPVTGVIGRAQVEVWTWNPAKNAFEPKMAWKVLVGEKIPGSDAVLSNVATTQVPKVLRKLAVIEASWPDGVKDQAIEGELPEEIAKQLGRPRR